MSGCVRLGIALKKKKTKGCEGDVFKYLVSINFICILSIYILLGIGFGFIPCIYIKKYSNGTQI